MSTHASIAILNEDGTINASYLHFDGYISWAGKTLKEFYNTRELAGKLIALGNLSTLQPILETSEEHSFEDPHPGVTVAYCRDRGEVRRGNTRYVDMEWYRLTGPRYDYNYIFANGSWYLLNKKCDFIEYGPEDEENE